MGIASGVRAWRIGGVLLLAAAGVLTILASGSMPPAPPAQTPVLELVFKPGPTLTNVGIGAAGEFDVLPSSGVIVWVRAPYPSGMEVAVDGAVLEETSSVPRQQALEAQGLGHWHHDTDSPDIGVSGTPRWKIVVAPAPSLRTSQRFTISLTGTSGNATTPRSPPLSVKIAIGIPDWVAIRNNTGNDNAVVLVDGRRTTGCADDELFRGRNLIDVGDLRSMGNCNEEVTVFSVGHAVELYTANTVWTDSLRDYIPVNLQPPWTAPAAVWLLGPGLSTRAAADIARANGVFDSSRCGIALNATFTTADNATARGLLGTDDTQMCGGAWINALRTSAFFTAGRLNIYYLNAAMPGARGLNCTGDQNIMVIGTTGDNESTAHELGHSFTLGHSNSVTGIPGTNIMVTGAVGRTEFTKGQCFRMSLNQASTLNTNLVRTGWIRNCPDNGTNNQCPALNLDVP
jgi:hypothetical protein